jgi:hypothetical protein
VKGWEEVVRRMSFIKKVEIVVAVTLGIVAAVRIIVPLREEMGYEGNMQEPEGITYMPMQETGDEDFSEDEDFLENLLKDDDEAESLEEGSNDVYDGFPEGYPKGGLYGDLKKLQIPPGFEIHNFPCKAVCDAAGRLDLTEGPAIWMRKEHNYNTASHSKGLGDQNATRVRKQWNVKEEYREKLEKFLAYFDYDETAEEEDVYANRVMYELTESRDVEVLRGLVWVLTKKIEGCGMLDESLLQAIFRRYAKKQVMEALFEIFDTVYDNYDHEKRCGLAYILEDMCSILWIDTVSLYESEEEGKKVWKEKVVEKGCFPEFREKFNEIRPKHAERFLNEREKYKVEKETPLIQTLRSDMEKW